MALHRLNRQGLSQDARQCVASWPASTASGGGHRVRETRSVVKTCNKSPLRRRIWGEGMQEAVSVQLVKDAKAGDQTAFESLLKPLIEPGHRFASAMLHDPQAAEDVVQEASIKAWTKLHQLREGTEMRPWFLGIVANQCRSTRRQRWWSVIKTAEPRRVTDPPSEAVTAGTDLRRAIRNLDHRDRTVLVLYFYLDLPLEEIAATTGTTSSAVRGQLYRAVHKLRPALIVEED
jgi:RNA polymerase sigma-70 factor (ECF subfamily)